MGAKICRIPLDVADCIKKAILGTGKTNKAKRDEYESNFLLDLDYDSAEDEERRIILNQKAQPVSRLTRQKHSQKSTSLMDSDSEEDNNLKNQKK